MPGLFGLGLLALVLGLSQPAHAQEFDFKGLGTPADGAVQSGSQQTPLMGRFDWPCTMSMA